MRKILGATLALAAGFAAAGGLASSASAMAVAKHPAATGGATLVDMRQHQWREHQGGNGHRYGYGHRYHRNGIVLRFGDSGGGGCYWLKRRALDTGSRYWWHRYHECRN